MEATRSDRPDTRRAQSSIVYCGGSNPCSIAVIRGFTGAGFGVHVLEVMPSREAGVPPPRGEVVNKDVVVTHMASAVRGRLSPLDYPRKPRWWHVMRDLLSLLRSMDSQFYPGDARGYLKRVVRFTLRRFV